MAATHAPPGLQRSRHLDLQGRSHHVWQRRVGLVIVACLPVLALLNVFGQRAHPVVSSAPTASLTVNSPTRVRGGLIFTSEFVITPHIALKDVRLLLSDGWYQGMTFNGSAPQPSTESAAGDWQILDYGPMTAGTPYPIFISWQTNPTNVGRHSQNVMLDDGKTSILTVHRSLTVFP
jgi:hypothetical protein